MSAIVGFEALRIDYCPTCRGVWLDRGELDKIIERENRWIDERDSDGRDAGSAKVPERKPEAPKKKKVSSFLQDITEMGQG